VDDYIITPEMLKIPMIKEKLLQCEEFSGIEELIILDSPNIAEVNIETGQVVTSPNSDEKTKIIQTKSVIIESGLRFKGKFYLYSFTLTPAVYDTCSLLTPVKDNITIGPAIFDNNFVPITPVTFFINPELMQDNLSLSKECTNKEFSEKLLKAWQNREEYLCKGIRRIIIRGSFEFEEPISRGDEEYIII
jgi:hypothetical protein